MILIYLYLFFLYIRPQDWVPFLMGLPTATLIIPTALILGWMERRKAPAHYKTPLAPLMLAYIVVLFLTTTLAVDASQGQFWAVEFLKRVLVFFMAIWVISSVERIKKAVGAILFMSAILAYQAYLQAVYGQAWGGQTVFPGYEEIRVRWYGDWDGPNVYGILFVIAAAITFELLISAKSIKHKILAGLLLCAYFMAIYFTNSRGAVLAFGVTVLFRFKDYLTNIKAMVLGGGFVVVALALLPSRLSEVNSKEASAHERTWLWETGLNLLRENPLTGVGRGEFINNNSLGLIAHNNYVQNFAETGLLGFFIFCSFIWFALRGNYLASKPNVAIPYELLCLNRMMNMALIGYCAATFFVVMENDLLFFVLGLSCTTYLVSRRIDPTIPMLQFNRKELAGCLGLMTTILVMIWLAAVKQIL